MAKNRIVANVFPITGPHLNQSISQFVESQFSRTRIYLREEFGVMSIVGTERDNYGWIGKLTSAKYCGVLHDAWWRKSNRINGKMRLLCEAFWPQFSFPSLLKILIGPKYWLFHGRPLSFATVLLFRMCGKKVSVVNWGGPIRKCGPRFWGFKRASYKMLSAYYVLMSPEQEQASQLIGNTAKLLPYPTRRFVPLEQYHQTVDVNSRILILGNNGFRRNQYVEILDKLPVRGWDKIICMMNYGREGEIEQNKEFINRYKARFGEAFFAWEKKLPFEEYVKAVELPPIYICPAVEQSGVGAASISFRFGRAVFLRGDNLKWFRSLGLKCHDIDEIRDWSYEALIKYVPNEEEYFENARKLFNYRVSNSVERWGQQIMRDFGLQGES